MDPAKAALWGSLGGVVITSAIAVVNQVVTSNLTLSRERKLVVWKIEIDRLLKLEELCGTLHESLGSYTPLSQFPEISSQMMELHVFSGRFARYPDLVTTLRDFKNNLCRIIN